MFDALRKNKAIKDLIIDKSVSENRKYLNTNIISLNLIFNGKVKGGIVKGKMSSVSADSAHGKSLVGYVLLANAQKQGMKCILIDAERAFEYDSAEKFGIDTSEDKLLVIRTAEIIEAKRILSEIRDMTTTTEERENVFVLLDSFGVLLSHAAIKKAAESSETQEMTLPKTRNELSNFLLYSNFTVFIINNVVTNLSIGSTWAIPGGKRLYLNCDSIALFSSKAKLKDADGVVDGSVITMQTQKSRKAKEGSKLKFRITFEDGLNPWFGLLDDALEFGKITRVGNFYTRSHIEDDKKWKEKDIYCSEFWVPIFKDTDFEFLLDSKYSFQDEEQKIKVQDIGDLW